MISRLTIFHFLFGGFVFALIFNFALAAFLDHRWRKGNRRRNLKRGHGAHFTLQSAGRTDKAMASNLQTPFADLSASGLGTAGQRIAFREKALPVLEEELPFPVSRAN